MTPESPISPKKMPSGERAKPRVVIIGGGLTGLTAAYALQQRGDEAGEAIPFTVLEKGSRWGGNLVTEKVDGFLIEGGADSFIARKPWAMDMARELGLEADIIRTPATHGRVYVLRQGRLVPLPKGMRFVVPTQIWPLLASPLLSWPGKLRMGLERWIPKKGADGEGKSDESLASFIRRRFGREALEVIGEPLMAGIHAADPERLSLEAAFPDVAALEHRFGSLVRGMKAVHSSLPARAQTENSSRVTLRGGVQQLVAGLVDCIDPASLRLRSPVVKLRRQGPTFEVELEAGGRLQAEAVILATPAFAGAKLVGGLDAGLAESLESIPYISSATVSLGFREEDVGRPMDALGFVIPGNEPSRLQACTWSSAKFSGRAPASHVLMRAFVGGARNEGLVELSDEELEALVLAELGPVMRLSGDPVLVRIHRWRQGIPQYHLGHLERLADIEGHGVEGLFLAGNAYRGVGLPDCIRSGRQAVDGVVDFLGRRGE